MQLISWIAILQVKTCLGLWLHPSCEGPDKTNLVNSINEALRMASEASYVLKQGSDNWSAEVGQLVSDMFLSSREKLQELDVSEAISRYDALSDMPALGTPHDPTNIFDVRIYCAEFSRYRIRNDGLSFWNADSDTVIDPSDEKDNFMWLDCKNSKEDTLAFCELPPGDKDVYMTHPRGIRTVKGEIVAASQITLCPKFWQDMKGLPTYIWDTNLFSMKTRLSNWVDKKNPKNKRALTTPIDKAGRTMSVTLLHEFFHTWVAGYAEDHKPYPYGWKNCKDKAHDGPPSWFDSGDNYQAQSNAESLALFAHALRFVTGSWPDQDRRTVPKFKITDYGAFQSIDQPNIGHAIAMQSQNSKSIFGTSHIASNTSNATLNTSTASLKASNTTFKASNMTPNTPRLFLV